MTKTIAVGSENPIKLAAVKEGFSLVWPKDVWEVTGVSVESGVSDQPMSDIESIEGATNRARRAREAFDADYGVGLEGGLQEIEGRWFDCGWVAIVDRAGTRGLGSSARIIVPERMMELIRKGYELGAADDEVFGLSNSKQAGGHFGVMTDNAITRKQSFRDGVVAALAVFIHPELME